MEKTFDPKCHDLAAQFTADLDRKVTPDEVNDLAYEIQEAIDAWMDREDERAEERYRAAYDDYIERKIDEFRETGIRTRVMPYKPTR